MWGNVFVLFTGLTAATEFQCDASEGPGCGNAPGTLVQVLTALRSNRAGLDIVQDSHLIMTKMFNDITATNMDDTELLTGIQNTALKYRKVHSEATNVVASVGESASQMVKWLPVFKRLVSEGKQGPALAVLKKMTAELEPTAARFQEYSDAHADIRDEVEGFALKATEMGKSAERSWRLIDGPSHLPNGNRMESGKWYKCEYVYPMGIPEDVTPNANNKCLFDPNLSFGAMSFLSFFTTAVAAPVAFVAGGPAGPLVLASTASFFSTIGAAAYGEAQLSRVLEFSRLRNDLNGVHEKLVEQVNAFKEIQRRLELISKSTDFMVQMAEDPELKELLDGAIDEARTRFSDVKKVCNEYIQTTVAPGTDSLKLLDAKYKGNHAVAEFLQTQRKRGQELLRASSQGEKTTMIRELIASGAPVDYRDASEKTPLHWASYFGHIEIVTLLLKNGANPNTADRHGNTPLILAAQMNKIDIVRALVDAEANTAARGGSPKMTATEWAKAKGNHGVAEFLAAEDLLNSEFKKVIGQQEVKKTIRLIARRVARDRLLVEKGITTGLQEKGKYHMVFSGNPGTGKSFVASVVAKLLLRLGVVESDRVVNVRTGNELISKYVGATPEKVRSKVKEAKGGVLMIDEAYTLSQHLGPNQGSGFGAYGKEAIDTLMEFMSPPQLVMIFAGYEREMKNFLEVNQGLKRRIPYIFQFKDYTIEELVAIFNLKCKSKGLTCEEGMDEELTKNLGFAPPRMLSERNAGVAADIINIAQDFLSARVSTEEMKKNPKLAVHLHKDDVKKAMIQLGFVRDYTGGGSVGADGKQQSIQEFLDDIFKKIIGHEDIKKMLRGFAKKIQADLKRAEIKGKADKRRHKDRYHMVFEGPPGTGKSMWAKAVAKILVRLGVVPHDDIIEVSSPLDLLASFLGQTPAKVDHVVQQARGGVVVIDEAYQLLTKSHFGGQSEAGPYAKQAIDTIMKHMDPPQCVFVFCGYEDLMEEFLKVNSGIARRLYKKFVFHPYSTEDLSRLFHVMLKSAGETLQDPKRDGAEVEKLLKNVPLSYTKDKNGGFIENWIQNSRLARDDLMDFDEMEAHPERLTQLNGHHLKVGLSSTVYSSESVPGTTEVWMYSL